VAINDLPGFETHAGVIAELSPEDRLAVAAPGDVGDSGAIPMGWIGTPVDDGETILFLSAHDDDITGQTINVDGGLTT